MAILDVDSLFTNIPLDETIDICMDSLYKDDIFAWIVCIKMMRITLRPLRLFFVICPPWPPKNRFLSFTANSINKLMVWSPLSSALANTFMCSFKNKWPS